jgi:hypothetical protein
MPAWARHQTFNTVRVASTPINEILFPSNYAISPRMELRGANLLPFTDATYIWEVRPDQQTGYYTTFFWGNNSGSAWPVNNEQYYGFHPYPDNGVNGVNHNWEASINFNDYITDDNANNTSVVKGVRYLQAAKVIKSGGTITAKFWWNLPDTTKVITVSFSDNYNVNTAPALIIGGAPWDDGLENLGGAFRRCKFFNTGLTEADIFSEAANMTQLVTAAGLSNIWFGKTNWSSINDLSCNYSTGRALVWNDTGNKATWVAG